MIEEEFIQYSCTRKIRHATKKRAIKELAKMKHRNKVVVPELQVYECFYCKGFHIGKLHKDWRTAICKYEQAFMPVNG